MCMFLEIPVLPRRLEVQLGDFKGVLFNSNTLFLWHEFVDMNKRSEFPKFVFMSYE